MKYTRLGLFFLSFDIMPFVIYFNTYQEQNIYMLKMPIPNLISVAQLHALMGTPTYPVILDVRISEDFNDDPRIIPAAIKRDFDKIDTLAEECLGKDVVVYCQKGLKISQGCAALLRQRGIKAEFLEGGQFAWRDAGFPMVNASKIPRKAHENSTLWVTHDLPNIDAMACAWLIKRFIDPYAKYLFVESSQVMNVADRFNATAFAIEKSKASNDGMLCSFDAMLKEFDLISSEALGKLAMIIRGASNNDHDLALEAMGLKAISIGLSAMVKDDLKKLEASMVIFDSLYRWCHDGEGAGYHN